MTSDSIGIRGVSPFAATPQSRRRLPERGSERSLAKHADAKDDDGAAQEPESLDPGRLIDITV